MQFLETTYRLVNKYNQNNKKPKKYGTDDLLYPAEVHMIEIIGSYEYITTTKLSKILGITKGAVSQTTTKLLDKDLIIKDTSKSKSNEVFISLSEKGKKVYGYHREKHKDMIEKINMLIEELSPESVVAIEKLIDIIDKSLDEMN